MQLSHGVHLAYCTNIHRGESWAETMQGLERYTLAVRDRVADGRPFAIGLRLSDLASRELAQPQTLDLFRRWLDHQHCYVFTINGFPYGQFHGTRVKEHVYAPDWTTPDRLRYTQRLFDLLSVLVPAGVEGSVSTVPVTFKEFARSPSELHRARTHLWQCVEHIERCSQASGRSLHLGLEPEPLCYLETTAETLRFFEAMRHDRPGDTRLDQFLGVNYDCCHLAVEFEEGSSALEQLHRAGIRISKIHLSSALKVQPTSAARQYLRTLADETYLHQVVARVAGGELRRWRDLDVALAAADVPGADVGDEWRVHFHIPLHCRPQAPLQSTADELSAVLDLLGQHPRRCPHLEMETYTWEVLPTEWKQRDVVDQLVGEYHWTLDQLRARGLKRE